MEKTPGQVKETIVAPIAKEEIKIVDKSKDVDPVQPDLKQQLGEKIVAPEAKKEVKKLEIPTYFTAKQKALFLKLSQEQQTTLVKNLTARYGYETLYRTRTNIKKVEIPTYFTAAQKTLFLKLNHEQQTRLVKKLTDQYGYETLYPSITNTETVDSYDSVYQTNKYSYQSQSKYHSNYNNGHHNTYDRSYNNNTYGCR